MYPFVKLDLGMYVFFIHTVVHQFHVHELGCDLLFNYIKQQMKPYMLTSIKLTLMRSIHIVDTVR